MGRRSGPQFPAVSHTPGTCLHYNKIKNSNSVRNKFKLGAILCSDIETTVSHHGLRTCTSSPRSSGMWWQHSSSLWFALRWEIFDSLLCPEPSPASVSIVPLQKSNTIASCRTLSSSPPTSLPLSYLTCPGTWESRCDVRPTWPTK